jgi:putative transposase
MPLAPQEIRTFFITTVTANRRRLFQVESNAHLLLWVLEQNRTKNRFQIHGFVVMPDHLHLLLTPAKDVSLEKAMQFIKGGFSFQLKSKSNVWQESFNEQRIKDPDDYVTHKTYIEENPVRSRLATSRETYPFSSASQPNAVDPAPAHLQEIPRQSFEPERRP